MKYIAAFLCSQKIDCVERKFHVEFNMRLSDAYFWRVTTYTNSMISNVFTATKQSMWINFIWTSNVGLILCSLESPPKQQLDEILALFLFFSQIENWLIWLGLCNSTLWGHALCNINVSSTCFVWHERVSWTQTKQIIRCKILKH